MKKPVVAIIAVLVLVAGYFGWSLWQNSVLDDEIAFASEQVSSYQTESEVQVRELEEEYPGFFAGGGFDAIDFNSRPDLVKTAEDYIAGIDNQREWERSRAYSKYSLVFGAQPKIGNLLEEKDRLFVEKIVEFSDFNEFKLKYFGYAQEYCESGAGDADSVAKRLASNTDEERQLRVILRNAEKNLC